MFFIPKFCNLLGPDHICQFIVLIIHTYIVHTYILVLFRRSLRSYGYLISVFYSGVLCLFEYHF